MSTPTIVMMTLICGLVWGGFLALLVRAVVFEGRKDDPGPEDHPVHPSP